MTASGRPRRFGLALPDEGPQRALVMASFVNRVGNGLFNSAAALYFTRVVHLSPGRVGTGLTIAGLIGLLAGFPAGQLADRHRPRSIMLATLAAQTASMIAFVFVRSWWAFTVVATFDLLALSANGAARGAVVARVGGGNPGAFRAKLRAYVNLGVVLGTCGAAVAVQADTRAAYTALILGNAASYVGCGLLLLRVPDYRPLPRPEGDRRLAAVRDRPFLAFAALNGAMGLQYPVVSLLLPIWIAAHTHAPRWTVAAIAAVNAAVCVLFQSRVGSTVEGLRAGGRAFRTGGLLFLVSCPLMALAADVPASVPAAAVALLVLAIVVHSLGEVWESSGGIALGYGFAPDHAQGRYQGLIGVGFDLGQAVAPAVLTTVCLGLGQAGWLLLAGFLAGVGLAGRAVAAWGERTRAGLREVPPQLRADPAGTVPGP